EKMTADELRAPSAARPAIEAPPVEIPDEKFAAPSLDSAAMKLELAVDAPPPRKAPPPPSHSAPREDDFEEEKPAPLDIQKPIPGKLMQGALRYKPGLRIGAGLVLALLVGYAASTPYSDRAARRVAAIRAEADH